MNANEAKSVLGSRTLANFFTDVKRIADALEKIAALLTKREKERACSKDLAEL